MNTILLDDLTIDILTMYVNVIWRKKEMIKFKKTKQDRISTINELCTELRKIN
jgi:hypothetical protein